jgi:putative nucleotidyltransferase with HDIG domain
MASRLAYRVGQVRSAYRATVTDADRAEALWHLKPALGTLFLRMAPRDQLHALRVLRGLDEDAKPLLRQAALLHDVGKSEAPMGTTGRSLVVIAKASGTMPVLMGVPGLGPRVRRYIDHPRIGAEMLREAGADGPLVQIVAEHESEHPSHPETAILQAMDGRT